MTSTRKHDRPSAVPKHDQLRQLIIDYIRDNARQPGALLPGEHQLCAQYGVSRTVVRRALAQLAKSGLVERVRGKGTFVAHLRTDHASVHPQAAPHEDADCRSEHVGRTLLRHEPTPASAEVAAALEILEGATVVMLDQLIQIDGIPSLSTTWMPEDVRAVALGRDVREGSLCRQLSEHGSNATSRALCTEATVATREQARLLNVRVGSPLLRVLRVSRDAEGRPIEFCITHHRGDRVRFEFQLARTAPGAQAIAAAAASSSVVATS